MENHQSFYIDRTSKLLKFYDKCLKPGHKIRASRYGSEMSETIRREARVEFEKLIPKIPYVGGNEPFTRQMILATVWLAIYKVMKKQGKGPDEIWELCSDMNETFIHSMPKIMRAMMRSMLFSNKMKKTYQKQAQESQKGQFPDADVFTFIGGEEEFDYGIDIIECAKCKFYRKEEADDFLPYICLIDKLWSELYGYGFIRTQTLAEGGDKCDFRLKKTGPVSVSSTVWKQEWDKS